MHVGWSTSGVAQKGDYGRQRYLATGELDGIFRGIDQGQDTLEGRTVANP